VAEVTGGKVAGGRFICHIITRVKLTGKLMWQMKRPPATSTNPTSV